jgi:hypothetical protein
MAEESAVPLTSGLPETVLPPPGPADAAALDAAQSGPESTRHDAVAAVAARSPRYLAAWAALAELGRDDVEGYADGRVGDHRGLGARRAAGWRGNGYVRWIHPTNRGFLRALDQLRVRAGAIGERDEEDRCALFLRQLDPDWAQRADC